MARMPGARWRPLAANWASQPRMTRVDLVLIHTAVGSFEGTFAYFSGSGGYSGAESHFMTGGGGEIDQYQDTAHQAEANGAANGDAISIENADMGPGFAAWNTRDGNAVPAFTPAQIEANARICAWAHTTHGVPLELIPDSKPGRRGIGYHRLGVPGYMVAGGEKWSSATGKVCPGNRRIAQIPQIIARARQLVGGAAPVIQEDDMPDNETIKRLVWEVLYQDDVRERLVASLIRPIYDTLTPGVEGVKHDGDVYRWTRDAAARTSAIAALAEKASPAVPALNVDAEDVAEALASTPGFARTLAAELADELDRRARDNNPSTGPTT